MRDLDFLNKPLTKYEFFDAWIIQFLPFVAEVIHWGSFISLSANEKLATEIVNELFWLLR